MSHNERYYNLNITQSKVLVRYYPLFQFVGKVLPVAITILGGISVMNGNMSLGALVAYVEYSRNCTGNGNDGMADKRPVFRSRII